MESPGGEVSNNMDGLEELMQRMDLAEQDVIALVRKGFFPPIQISSFSSLKDTYQQSINKLDLSFLSCKVLPWVDPSEWGHASSGQCSVS